MFCGQGGCSDVPDTGEQPHQEPQSDSKEGTPAAGSSAGRVCAGVFVVEATPDTEDEVEARTAQEYRIQNTLSCQAFAQSYSLMPSRKHAPVSSGAPASPTITQDDEDDDGYGYGGEMDTDTRPLRARAHRPRQNTEYRIHCHVKPLHKATR